MLFFFIWIALPVLRHGENSLSITQSPNQILSPLGMLLWVLGRVCEYTFLSLFFSILFLFFLSPFIVIMTHTLHWHSLSAREPGKQSILCCVLRGKKFSTHISSSERLAGPQILAHTFSYHDANTQQISYWKQGFALFWEVSLISLKWCTPLFTQPVTYCPLFCLFVYLFCSTHLQCGYIGTFTRR